jgi:hypothetical protein
MSLNLKVLGNGTIGAGTSASELLTAYSGSSYAVPTGKAVIIKSVRVANKDTIARTFTINYLPGGSSARAISPIAVSIAVNSLFLLDDEIILNAGDKLQAIFGQSQTTNPLDFVVGGVERDQS